MPACKIGWTMLIYVNSDGHLKRFNCHFEFISSFFFAKNTVSIDNATDWNDSSCGGQNIYILWSHKTWNQQKIELSDKLLLNSMLVKIYIGNNHFLGFNPHFVTAV